MLIESREQHSPNIAGVDFTSAAFLSRPRELFAATNEVNADIKDPEKRLGIELYPFLRKVVLGDVLHAITLGKSPFPIGVTEDRVRTWQREFPLTKVERVHLEFNFDKQEENHRIFVGERENGKRHQAYQIIWKVYFGPAISMRGVELAHALEDQRVGVNAHMNVWGGFAKVGKTKEVKSKVAFALGENERDYDIEQRLLPEREYVYNPIRVAELVEQLNLNGMVLGIDHALDEGQDIAELLNSEKVRRNTRVIHFAKSNHGVITPQDAQAEKVLRQIKETTFDNGPVRIAFDFGPDAIKGLSHRQIMEKMRVLREWALAA